MTGSIGVGIIGVAPGRSWAAKAHIPALQALPEFDLVAVSTTRQDSADAAAQIYGVPHAFDNHTDLIKCPGVSLVVVTVKVPHHYELVTAALEAGKAVYCEWPLGNGLHEARTLAELAQKIAAPTVVGLQARMSPVIAHVQTLLRNGYVGDVLSTTVVGSGGLWGPVVDTANAYCMDEANGATMLSIPFAHTVDAVCHCLGEFDMLSATMANRRKRVRVAETGETKLMTAADQVAVTGVLKSGAVATVHYRGGLSRATNLLWEINGTEGDLQITGASGHAQMVDLTVFGARGSDKALLPLSVPQYPDDQGALGGNVSRMYSQLAKDWKSHGKSVPDFGDAVLRHCMLNAIEVAANTGQSQSY